MISAIIKDKLSTDKIKKTFRKAVKNNMDS